MRLFFEQKSMRFILGISIILPALIYGQALETEESLPLKQGQFEVGSGLEFQTSKEGRETALPLAIECGLLDKLTLLVEPVGFTSINPKIGQQAQGIGDLEVSLLFQILHEKTIIPSISLAGEVKLPTARNRLIGSGKTDYTPFLVISKTTGMFFTSINLGYSFVGKPQGVNANDQINYAVGTMFSPTPRNHLYAEIYGNTAATETPDTASASAAGSTELSGGETVASIAYGFDIVNGLQLSFGVSYDNNNALLFRPGIDWKFGGSSHTGLK